MTNVQFYNSSETYVRILEQRSESDYAPLVEAIGAHSLRGTLLDYGCGVGLLGKMLAERGYVVTGVDISERMIRAAKEKFAGTPALAFEVMTEIPLRFHAGAFDIVTTSSVLEHCTGVDAILLEFIRLLKHGGLLVIETPNMLSPLARMKLIARRLTGERKDFHKFGTPMFLLKSIYYLLKKIILRRGEFIYVSPEYDKFAEADEDVSYLSNHLDYFYFLRDRGFTILELSRNTGVVRKFISKHLPYIAGGVLVIARKE